MSIETQIKIFKFLERLWLVGGLLFIGVVIYFIITKDNDSALFFLGLVILSGLFYILRRKQRIRYTLQVEKNKALQIEKNKGEQTEKKK